MIAIFIVIATVDFECAEHTYMYTCIYNGVHMTRTFFIGCNPTAFKTRLDANTR